MVKKRQPDQHDGVLSDAMQVTEGPGKGAFEVTVRVHNETTFARWFGNPPTWEEAREVLADELMRAAEELRKSKPLIRPADPEAL